jgi:3-oxoacyl-(acyl-carrier-protein) synthase
MSIQISGTGSVACTGLGVDNLFAAALHDQSGVIDGLGKIPDSVARKLRTNHPEVFQKSITLGYAYAAALQAMQNAGWTKLSPDDGIIFATTTGQISRWEPELMHFLKGESTPESFSEPFSHQSLGLCIEDLANLFEFRGRTQLVTSACSAGTQAIALAAMWVRSGKVKRCLVGGVEILSELTTSGFSSLQLLLKEPARPFDRNRHGINLSEAAAFLCLENNSENPLAQISGYGLSTDAFHLASPEPEGAGCLRAMRSALKNAKLNPSQVSWVHAHGTGSRANDQAECAAVNALFPETPPWVSSTKNIHGHALGASGALETVLCVEALQRGVILKTAGLQIPDPTLNLKHPTQNLNIAYDHILKNTLGFGGNNAALVISRVTR